MANKERLDVLVNERGLCKSREKAKREIMAGNVFVSGQLKDKPGKKYPADSEITLERDEKRFVSRGGKKLEGALEEFDLDVSGWKAVDIGASTGGFTDCLLRHGAEKVWSLDVGKGQLDWNLRKDERVEVIEGKNARHLKPEEIGTPVELVTIDVSFISLELILPNANNLLTPEGKIISLVKPQFEAGPELVEKGGVVTDPEVHRDVLNETVKYGENSDLIPSGCTYSPIQGKSGKNIEYFLFFTHSGERMKRREINRVVESAHKDFS